MTPTTNLGLSICLSMFELHETGDWDIFIGSPERARAETGGVDQWVLKRRESLGVVRVNQVTSASLRYPLSVLNKNSTVKRVLGILIQTKHARKPDGAQDSTIFPSVSGTGALRETTRFQDQVTIPSLRSKTCAV